MSFRYIHAWWKSDAAMRSGSVECSRLARCEISNCLLIYRQRNPTGLAQQLRIALKLLERCAKSMKAHFKAKPVDGPSRV